MAIAPLLLPLLTGLIGSRMMDKQIQADREQARRIASSYGPNGTTPPLAETRPRPLDLGGAGAEVTGLPQGTRFNPITDVRPSGINRQQTDNNRMSYVPSRQIEGENIMRTQALMGDKKAQDEFRDYSTNLPDIQLVDKKLRLRDPNGNEATYTIQYNPYNREMLNALRGAKTQTDLEDIVGNMYTKDLTEYDRTKQTELAKKDVAQLPTPRTRSQALEELGQIITGSESLLRDLDFAFAVDNPTAQQLDIYNEQQQTQDKPTYTRDSAKQARLFVSDYVTEDASGNFIPTQKAPDYNELFGQLEGQFRPYEPLNIWQSEQNVDIINAMKRLQAGETLENFAKIKAEGVTFGATNNTEIALIRDSGSKLKFTGSIEKNMEYALDMKNKIKDVIGRSALEFAAIHGESSLPANVQNTLDTYGISLKQVALDNKRDDMIKYIENGGFVDKSLKSQRED
jgi:hypothetical protein